jgi:NAD(P)-dependent dehydrogenase (short-subunit alcohol dehydrogenase family)
MTEASYLSASPLSGKVAFVAGGTGVLGEAISRGLARAGAKVAIGGPQDERLVAVTQAIAESGAEARAIAFDARSVKDIGRAVDGVCDAFGGCDILVNSVGIHREQLLLEATEESYDSVIQLNLKAAMFLA